MDYEEALKDDVFRNIAEAHCPNVDKQPIVVADRVKQVINNVGKYLGIAFKALGGLIDGGVKAAGGYLDKKIEEPQEKTEVNPATKEKWEKLKKGTGQVVEVSK